jgi:hypothetical protein
LLFIGLRFLVSVEFVIYRLIFLESVEFERRSLAGRMKMSIKIEEITLLPGYHYYPLFENITINKMQALKSLLPFVPKDQFKSISLNLINIFKKGGNYIISYILL